MLLTFQSRSEIEVGKNDAFRFGRLNLRFPWITEE
jgi:hypothetical protein